MLIVLSERQRTRCPLAAGWLRYLHLFYLHTSTGFYHLACSFCGSKRGTLIAVGGTSTEHALLPCSLFPPSY